MKPIKPCLFYDSPCWCSYTDTSNPDCEMKICKEAREKWDDKMWPRADQQDTRSA